MSNDKQYTPVQWLQVELSKRVPAEFWAENMDLFIQAQSMERARQEEKKKTITAPPNVDVRY
jgi:hypothetical protein